MGWIFSIDDFFNNYNEFIDNKFPDEPIRKVDDQVVAQILDDSIISVYRATIRLLSEMGFNVQPTLFIGVICSRDFDNVAKEKSRISAADKIIVLTPLLSVQETRIWKRYEERISGVVTSKKRETLEGIQKLLEWNREYNLKKLPHFIENCEYKEKIITVSNNLDVLELLSK